MTLLERLDRIAKGMRCTWCKGVARWRVCWEGTKVPDDQRPLVCACCRARPVGILTALGHVPVFVEVA